MVVVVERGLARIRGRYRIVVVVLELVRVVVIGGSGDGSVGVGLGVGPLEKLVLKRVMRCDAQLGLVLEHAHDDVFELEVVG